MNVIVLSIFLTVAEADEINANLNCITIRNANYKQELLYKDISGPYHLAVDYNSNILYFSYTVRKTDYIMLLQYEFAYVRSFKLAYLDLETKEISLVTQVREGFATAIDREANIVYMGGEDGIYTYHSKSNHVINLGISNSSIWQMFYRNGLYFTTFPEGTVHLYKDGKVMEPPEFKTMTQVKLLAVQKDTDYVFSNNSGLYTYNRGTGKLLLKDTYTPNGFTTDKDGNLYFSTSSGFYYINESSNKIELLTNIDNVFGFAFEENGDMIYSDADSIIRLTPTTCINGIVTET